MPWQTAEAHAPELIHKLMDCDIPQRTLINVNFPNCQPDEVEGIEITGQGSYTHGLYMEKRHDGRGFPYYWLRFGRDVPEQKLGADIAALANRRISVTPLKLDLTHETFRAELAGLFEG